MAGERLAGSILKKYLAEVGKPVAESAGKFLGNAAEQTTNLVAAPIVSNITGNIANVADAPGIRGKIAEFIGDIDPAFVGRTAGKVAEIAGGAGTALTLDMLSNIGQRQTQTPSKQQIDPRQKTAYNAMFAQQMQATQGMQPVYAPSPMQQFTPQGRLISEQGNNKVVQQYYYNPSDPLTAAARMYASMPKMSFPSVV